MGRIFLPEVKEDRGMIFKAKFLFKDIFENLDKRV